MKLYLRLAWRNIWRHKRRTFIVVIAIGLTLAMMMFYDGMIAGFEDAIYGNAIKVLGGNIQVHAIGYSEKMDSSPLLPLANENDVLATATNLPQVVSASRRINTGGLATNSEGAFAVGIIGVEPDKELAVNLVAQKVVSGRYLETDDADLVYIGKGLADTMNIAVGDRFTLVGRATHEQMRKRTVTVVGIFDIGMPDIEKRSVYMSLKEAQDLYDLRDQSTEVVIFLQRLGQEDTVLPKLETSLANYEIGSWKTNYPELEAAISTKSGVMDLFSVIILVIAGIGILNLLLMAVYERTREIGFLGAIGMKPGGISLLFLLEGLSIGIVGVVAGFILGLLLNYIFSKVGFDFSAFTSLTEYMALITGKIYTTLGLEKIVQRVLTVIIICTLAAYYPAREAARREPAEALHYV
jgi:ABC-type lipoprotein release transport system permease subunit